MINSLPIMTLSPIGLSLTATQGGANPPVQSVTLTHTGMELQWNASTEDSWLSLSGSGCTLTVSTNIAGLAPGTHTGTISVMAPNNAEIVPVSLTVSTGSTPMIGVSPTSLTFTATEGGAAPADQTLSLTNSGTETLSWTLSDNASWLTVSASSGTTTSESDAITLGVNSSGLSAGTYSAAVTVMASGATNSPRTVPVTLTVDPRETPSALLAWDANSDPDLAGYHAYRSTSPRAYGAPIATIPSTVTTYEATGLQVDTTYYFSVTALDTSGNESVFSNEVSKSMF